MTDELANVTQDRINALLTEWDAEAEALWNAAELNREHDAFIVVHSFGIWSFDSYQAATDFCHEEQLGDFDTNHIGTLKSRAVLIDTYVYR
jgi:hypothetical protein